MGARIDDLRNSLCSVVLTTLHYETGDGQESSFMPIGEGGGKNVGEERNQEVDY